MILHLKTENIMNGSYGSNIESSRNYSNYGKTVPLKILSANQENWITTDFSPFLASAFFNFYQMNDIISTRHESVNVYWCHLCSYKVLRLMPIISQLTSIIDRRDWWRWKHVIAPMTLKGVYWWSVKMSLVRVSINRIQTKPNTWEITKTTQLN